MNELYEDTHIAIIQVFLWICSGLLGVLPIFLLISYTCYNYIKRKVRKHASILVDNYYIGNFIVVVLVFFLVSLDMSSFDSYSRVPKKPYNYQWFNLNDILRFPADVININNGKIYPLRVKFEDQKKDSDSLKFPRCNYVLVLDKTSSVTSNKPVDDKTRRYVNRIRDRILKMEHVKAANILQGDFPDTGVAIADMYCMEMLANLYLLPNKDVSFQVVYYYGDHNYKPMLISPGKSMFSTQNNTCPMTLHAFDESIINIGAAQKKGNYTYIDDVIKAATGGNYYVEDAENHVVILSDFRESDTNLFYKDVNIDAYQKLNRSTILSLVKLDSKGSTDQIPAKVLNALQQRISFPLKQFYTEEDTLPRIWLSPTETFADESIYIFYPFVDKHIRLQGLGGIELPKSDDEKIEFMITKNDNTPSPTQSECKFTINNELTLNLNQLYTFKNTSDVQQFVLYADHLPQLDLNYFLTVYKTDNGTVYTKRYPFHIVQKPYSVVCYSLVILYYLLLLIVFCNFYMYLIFAIRMHAVIKKNRGGEDHLADKPNPSTNEKKLRRLHYSLYVFKVLAALILIYTFSGLVLHLFFNNPKEIDALVLFIIKLMLTLAMFLRVYFYFRRKDDISVCVISIVKELTEVAGGVSNEEQTPLSNSSGSTTASA